MLLKDLLIKSGVVNPSVQVWGIGQIKSFLIPFPSLVFDLKGFREGAFQSHDSWSHNDDMEKTLVVSDGYIEKLAGFVDTIRKRTQALHIRISDEAGVNNSVRMCMEIK